jgi:RimJ/RimL family protein N-acetyltransferase
MSDRSSARDIRLMNGRRLVLREFDASQISERYLRWLADPAVNRYSRRANTEPVSADQAAQYLMTLAKDEVVFGIHHPDNGHVGNIKYGPIDWVNRRADISIVIGECAVWGQGIGAESVYLVTKYLFEKIALNRVDAGTRNPAFVCLVQKLGWKIEGVRRRCICASDGYHDQVLVAQLAAEFVRRPEYEVQGVTA